MRLQHTVETFCPDRWQTVRCETTLQVAMIGIALRMNLALATPVSRILKYVLNKEYIVTFIFPQLDQLGNITLSFNVCHYRQCIAMVTSLINHVFIGPTPIIVYDRH